MEEAPEVIRSESIFTGRVFGVRVDTVREGAKERRLDIVTHPGSFAIAALPLPNQIVLVRQYRHAAGAALWEIPAGTAEPDESCQDGAARELREETGYTARSWELLCTAYPTPGYSTERVHLFAARDLQAGISHPDEDENIECREVSFEEARSMQASGEIVDMKTILALLWLAGRQDK